MTCPICQFARTQEHKSIRLGGLELYQAIRAGLSGLLQAMLAFPSGSCLDPVSRKWAPDWPLLPKTHCEQEA
ncbi:hypothetical protein AOLI_G00022210 [Acnodon oligacanthus]